MTCGCTPHLRSKARPLGRVRGSSSSLVRREVLELRSYLAKLTDPIWCGLKCSVQCAVCSVVPCHNSNLKYQAQAPSTVDLTGACPCYIYVFIHSIIQSFSQWLHVMIALAIRTYFSMSALCSSCDRCSRNIFPNINGLGLQQRAVSHWTWTRLSLDGLLVVLGATQPLGVEYFTAKVWQLSSFNRLTQHDSHEHYHGIMESFYCIAVQNPCRPMAQLEEFAIAIAKMPSWKSQCCW